MRISILFGQREEQYAGQYAPEALLAWDEFAIEENPSGWDESLEKVKREQSAAGGMTAMRVIDIEVDGDKIRRLLLKTPVVAGVIESADAP